MKTVREHYRLDAGNLAKFGDHLGEYLWDIYSANTSAQSRTHPFPDLCYRQSARLLDSGLLREHVPEVVFELLVRLRTIMCKSCGSFLTDIDFLSDTSAALEPSGRSSSWRQRHICSHVRLCFDYDDPSVFTCDGCLIAVKKL